MTCIAACLRFVFGCDLIGAYTQALLVKAMQDIKEHAERDTGGEGPACAAGNGGAVPRAGGAEFPLGGGSDAEERVRRKEEEVRECERRIVDAVDPDRDVLLHLRALLKDLRTLQNEQRAGEESGRGRKAGRAAAVKPELWRSKPRESGTCTLRERWRRGVGGGWEEEEGGEGVLLTRTVVVAAVAYLAAKAAWEAGVARWGGEAEEAEEEEEAEERERGSRKESRHAAAEEEDSQEDPEKEREGTTRSPCCSQLAATTYSLPSAPSSDS